MYHPLFTNQRTGDLVDNSELRVCLYPSNSRFSVLDMTVALLRDFVFGVTAR